MVRGGEARIVYCSPERFGSTVFLEAIGAAADRPARGRRGPLRLRVGPRLPPRLPAAAADRRPARPADGDGLHGDRDRSRSRRRSPPASACASRSRCAPASTGPTSPSTSSALEGKGSKARRQALLEAGLADPANRPAIVYCGTRKDTDEVAGDAARSRARGRSPTTPGMDAEERTAAQQRFMGGEAEVIVATNAFGMGVDKADVRSVWHMAIPTSVEAYYQEAGRAGRDGLPAQRGAAGDESRPRPPGPLQRTARGDPDLAIAHERGWRAYHAIKAFIYSERCRRRSPARPLRRPRRRGAAGALLRRLRRAATGCPTRRRSRSARRRSARGSAPPPPDLSPADAPLFEALKAWRLRGRRRQARLHRRQQPHPRRDRRRPPGRRRRPDRDQRRRPQLHLQVRRRGAGDRRRAPRRAWPA